MEQLVNTLLQLFFIVLGFAIMLSAVGLIKQSPGQILGNMIRATLKGAVWLLKSTFWLLGVFIRETVALIQAIARGAPANNATATDNSKPFLTGFDRWKLLNRWKDGIVLDGKRSISLQNSFRHVAVFSPTGGGKTSSVLIPAVLNLKTSAVINDPSGEIFARTSGWLHKQGFSVRVINVSDVEHSLSFDPLNRADSHTSIGQVADVLVRHAFPESRGDQFWNMSARGLISVLIRYLKHDPEYCNLYNLRFLLNSFGEDGSPLNSWIAKQPVDEATFSEWTGIISASPKVLQSVVSTAKAALEKVSDPSIARLTATETLHFEDLRGPRPTVIYIIVPEHETKYWSFLTDLLLLQIFSFCMKPQRPGEPYLPVTFLLDEFGHSRLPGFSTATVTMRKRDCAICILLQEPAMLEQTYGKADAATILGGGMVSKIFMPGLSLETCERLSRIIGKGDDHRPVLSPSQIRTLPDRIALLIHGSKKPVVLRMTPYFKNSKLLRRTRIPPTPLPESKTSTELHYVSLGKEEDRRQHMDKTGRSEETNTDPRSEGEHDNRRATTSPPPLPAPTKESETTIDQPLRDAKEDPPHTHPVTKSAGQPPSWAGELLQESRRAREEVETLREAIGVHVVTRTEAARILGKSTKTLQRWEKRGLLERVEVSAPGVHYAMDSILRLKQERS